MESIISGYHVSEMLEEFFATSIHLGVRPGDGKKALIKTLKATYPRNTDVARIRREFQVLERLQDVEGVIGLEEGLAPHGSGKVAIIAEAFGRP